VMPASKPQAELTESVLAENAALRAELAAKDKDGRGLERVSANRPRVRRRQSSKRAGTGRNRRRRTES